MCNFFSFNSDGKGNVFYFNAEQRAALREDNPQNYEPDSHTSIAHFHGFDASGEDKLNKWEYNPLTRKLVADQINTTNDEVLVKAWTEALDFKTIMPELVIKPIVHPLKVARKGPATKDEIAKLKKWASVYASVRDSVWASVGTSVGASVWASVYASVGTSVGASVWASVYASVGGSVWGSAYASVRDSVWAEISSFFQLQQWKFLKHPKNENPFQPCIDLWEAGLVPSFDSKTWRLHAGEKAEVVYEWVPTKKKSHDAIFSGGAA